MRYHRLGVVFEEVYCVYSYRQTPYMREHLLTLARTRATTTQECVKNACKTCAVSLYGMTIENKTQRKSLVLHTDEYC